MLIYTATSLASVAESLDVFKGLQVRITKNVTHIYSKLDSIPKKIMRVHKNKNTRRLENLLSFDFRLLMILLV